MGNLSAITKKLFKMFEFDDEVYEENLDTGSRKRRKDIEESAQVCNWIIAFIVMFIISIAAAFILLIIAPIKYYKKREKIKQFYQEEWRYSKWEMITALLAALFFYICAFTHVISAIMVYSAGIMELIYLSAELPVVKQFFHFAITCIMSLLLCLGCTQTLRYLVQNDYKHTKVYRVVTMIVITCILGYSVSGLTDNIEMTTGLQSMCEGGDQSEDDDFLKAINNVYSTADTFFCRSSATDCLCHIDYTPDPNKGSRDGIKYETSEDGVYRAQQCKSDYKDAYDFYPYIYYDQVDHFLSIMKGYEEEYQCAGMCKRNSVYYFSSTMNGEPKGSCWSHIHSKLMFQRVLPFGFTSLFGFAGFVFIVIHLILACNKKPRNEPSLIDDEDIQNSN